MIRKTLEGLNKTLITLIPKKNAAASMNDFHPINRCNVISKIISKVLANILKHVIDSMISLSQSIFVSKRLISDNAMIGFECIHNLNNKRPRKKGMVVLKLCMSKAYDRIEWAYLRKIMTKIGFYE